MAKGKGLNDQLDFMCSSEILTKQKTETLPKKPFF